MIKKAIAIIGAGFGDEGKGRMADVFSAKLNNCVVVRYNGGAQAGHTVVTPQNKAHIFHHFGSGSFTDADTYLSRYFIINPLVWEKERKELESLGIAKKLNINPDCIVTTPYDMLINREIENRRGDKKHGSCGLGINESIERFLTSKYRILAYQMRDVKFLTEMLQIIKKEYVNQRLIKLGIAKPSDYFNQLLNSNNLFDAFIDASQAILNYSKSCYNDDLNQWQNVIFEGAQGLLLDEKSENFPHVTRSRTGLDNIIQICEEARIKELEVVYVTRAYTTKHGSGPFPTEDKSIVYEDTTNIDNNYQGKIRFSHLDLDSITEGIKKDLTRTTTIKIAPSIAITCLDQVPEMVKYHKRGKLKSCKRDDLPQIIANTLGIKKIYVSTTKSRIS